MIISLLLHIIDRRVAVRRALPPPVPIGCYSSRDVGCLSLLILHHGSPTLASTHPHTSVSAPLLRSHCCSDSICVALLWRRRASAGFKIFSLPTHTPSPPVQICSTLKWISLFHLSPGLTGKWIILTGPVWSLFNLSPWFWVFLEQKGGRSKSLLALCGSGVNPGGLAGCLGPHWLTPKAVGEACLAWRRRAEGWNLISVAPLGSDYQAFAVQLQRRPVST